MDKEKILAAAEGLRADMSAFLRAMISHPSESREEKEVVACIKAELEKLGDATLGASVEARAAVYFDWDNWWALIHTAGPTTDLDYKEQILDYYRAFYDLNIPVDFVGAEDDLGGYRLLVAPVLYMVKEGYDEKIRRFVADGGIFVTTFFSGIVDEHDLVVTGGYPGRLRDILGIWVEEIDALPRDKENSFIYNGSRYPARLLCDLLHDGGLADARRAHQEHGPLLLNGNDVIAEGVLGEIRRHGVLDLGLGLFDVHSGFLLFNILIVFCVKF